MLSAFQGNVDLVSQRGEGRSVEQVGDNEQLYKMF
jgi:hypothetical protein